MMLMKMFVLLLVVIIFGLTVRVTLELKIQPRRLIRMEVSLEFKAKNMPFKKMKSGKYKSPSGRTMTLSQVKAYYAKNSAKKGKKK